MDRRRAWQSCRLSFPQGFSAARKTPSHLRILIHTLPLCARAGMGRELLNMSQNCDFGLGLLTGLRQAP